MTESQGQGTRPRAAYAGDVDPRTAFDALAATKDAVLVDVRTAAEWSFVGIADLSAIGKDIVMAEWQSFPAMTRNPAFESDVAAALKARGASAQSPVYFLCRSGARSADIVRELQKHGFRKLWNLEGGINRWAREIEPELPTY